MFHYQKISLIAILLVLVSGCADKKCDFSSDYLVQADGSESTLLNDIHDEAMIAQKFRPDSAVSVHSISFTIKKIGNPSGNLRISINSDDKGKPKKDPISDGGPFNADLSGVGETVLVEVTVKFTGHPDLSSGRDYYIVFDPSDDPSSTDYYELGSVKGGGAYAGGEVWRFDSEDNDEDTAWSEAPNEDLQFTIQKCEESKTGSAS